MSASPESCLADILLVKDGVEVDRFPVKASARADADGNCTITAELLNDAGSQMVLSLNLAELMQQVCAAGIHPRQFKQRR